jgi:hypothetical protein
VDASPLDSPPRRSPQTHRRRSYFYKPSPATWNDHQNSRPYREQRTYRDHEDHQQTGYENPGYPVNFRRETHDRKHRR